MVRINFIFVGLKNSFRVIFLFELKAYLFFHKLASITTTANGFTSWRRGAITEDKIGFVVFDFFKPYAHGLLFASVGVIEFLAGI